MGGCVGWFGWMGEARGHHHTPLHITSHQAFSLAWPASSQSTKAAMACPKTAGIVPSYGVVWGVSYMVDGYMSDDSIVPGMSECVRMDRDMGSRKVYVDTRANKLIGGCQIMRGAKP